MKETPTITIRSLILSLLLCLFLGCVIFWLFSRLSKPLEIEHSDNQNGRISRIEDRLAQLEKEANKLSQKLDRLMTKLDQIKSAPINIDRKVPAQKPEEHKDEQSKTSKTLVPVPWNMRFSGGDPKDFTLEELVNSLDLSIEKLSDNQIESLGILLEEYKYTQEELFNILNSEIESAALDLESKGKYYTRAEFDKAQKEMKKKPIGAMTEYSRRFGNERKFFLISHAEYATIAGVFEELRQSRNKFKNSIYETLVGPVPKPSNSPHGGATKRAP